MLTNESLNAYLDSLPWNYDSENHYESVRLDEIGKDSIFVMTVIHSMPKFTLLEKQYVNLGSLLIRRHANLPRRVKQTNKSYTVTKLNPTEMIPK